MSEIEVAQKRAWRFYKELKKEKTYSKALKGERVYFSELGWNHLAGNRRATKRTPADLLHRFEILSFVPDIVATGKIGGTRKDGHKLYAFLDKTYGRKIYRVVLGIDEKGKHIFISIIDVT